MSRVFDFSEAPIAQGLTSGFEEVVTGDYRLKRETGSDYGERVTLQRKYLVKSGDIYVSPSRRSETDVQWGFGVHDGSTTPKWMPVVEVWRPVAEAPS